MSLATAALTSMERKLPKVIDARSHGIIDYCHAAFFLGMALFCSRKNKRAATAALVTGSFVLVESLLTDYPLGAAKVMPFATHGKLDAAFAAASPWMPSLFGFSGTPEAVVFRANGLIEGAVVSMTDWNSERARSEEGLSSLAAD